jgi:subtilisin family serine protease
VLSTWKDNGYALDQGTSMAAPHISGLAALLLSEGYTNAQAVARINSTADNVNGVPRANAARAVGASSSTGTPKPTSRATHHSSPTPIPSVTQKTSQPAHSGPVKVPAPSSSAKPSPSVLGVGPTLSPGTTGNAAGAPVATSEKSRALAIGLSVFAIAVVGLGAIRVLRRRARRA